MLGDNSAKKHKEMFSFKCPFVYGVDVGNIPLSKTSPFYTNQVCNDFHQFKPSTYIKEPEIVKGYTSVHILDLDHSPADFGNDYNCIITYQ